MPRTSKEVIITLLGNKAIPFALYCQNKPTEYSKAISFLFEQVNEINLNDPVFQGMLQILLAEGVIDQSVIDRINVERGVVP